MTINWEIGEIFYFVQSGRIFKKAVKGIRILNTGKVLLYEGKDEIYAECCERDAETLVAQLVEEENKRHEERLKEIQEMKEAGE